MDSPTDECDVNPGDGVFDTTDLRNHIRTYLIADETSFRNICQNIAAWRGTSKAMSELDDNVFYKAAFEAAFVGGPVDLIRLEEDDPVDFGRLFVNMCKGCIQEIDYILKHPDAYSPQRSDFPRGFSFELAVMPFREALYLVVFLQLAELNGTNTPHYRPTPWLERYEHIRAPGWATYHAYNARTLRLNDVLLDRDLKAASTLEIVRELLETEPRANPSNYYDNDKQSAIDVLMQGWQLFATSFGPNTMAILKLLLDNGGRSYGGDAFKPTLLELVVTRITKAEPSMRTSSGYHEYMEILQLLLTPKTPNTPADLKYDWILGLDRRRPSSALHIAVANMGVDSIKVAKMLIAAGFPILTMNTNGDTIVTRLLKVRGFPYPVNSVQHNNHVFNMTTALTFLNTLKVPTADGEVSILHVPNFYDENALMIACQYLCSDIIELLVNDFGLGFLATKTDGFGSTVIDHVLKRVSFPRMREVSNQSASVEDLNQILRLLLANHAQVTAQHIDSAGQRGWSRGVEMLRDAFEED